MDPVTIVLALFGGLSFAGALFLLRETFRLRAERDSYRARIEDAGQAKNSFEALAGEVLRSSTTEFLKLAQASFSSQKTEVTADVERRRRALDEMIRPMTEALKRTHSELERMGRAQVGLSEQVVLMSRGHRELREETGRLVNALSKPNVRGRYGEIQLERVVELAGMKGYCDFTSQKNLRDEEGRLQKPDMVVRLPNSRLLAVDAKTSFDSYIDALGAASPEESDALLDRYAENVFEQARKLARKAYWANFEASPEFVIMFIPGEQLVDAALERRPDLIEYAAEHNVVLASPSTLIGLLRAVHVGWREKNLTDSAAELFDLGRDLHRRAAVVLEHAGKIGSSIDGARRAYNEFVGSVQSRLVPSLRRFEECDVRSAKELVELRPLEGEVRSAEPLQALDDETAAIEPVAPIPQSLKTAKKGEESASTAEPAGEQVGQARTVESTKPTGT